MIALHTESNFPPAASLVSDACVRDWVDAVLKSSLFNDARPSRLGVDSSSSRFSFLESSSSAVVGVESVAFVGNGFSHAFVGGLSFLFFGLLRFPRFLRR